MLFVDGMLVAKAKMFDKNNNVLLVALKDWFGPVSRWLFTYSKIW